MLEVTTSLRSPIDWKCWLLKSNRGHLRMWLISYDNHILARSEKRIQSDALHVRPHGTGR